MNYYEHHLGDYAKDTGHLSMLEHGAYRLLLDRYYSTEEGIPAAQAYRMARARSEEERQAVDAVLEEFFTLEDGVWINRRAEEEIAKAQVKINAAKENGKKGGRPKKVNPGSENETQQKPSGFSAGSENETQQKAHQAPSTKHQTPDVEAAAATGSSTGAKTETLLPPIRDPIEVRSTELAILLRQRGAQVNPGDPRLRSIAESGATDAQLLTVLEIAQQRRADSGSTAPISAGFLASILPDVLTPPSRASPAISRADKHPQQRRRTIHDERADTIAHLTGRSQQAEPGRIIDITPGAAHAVD